LTWGVLQSCSMHLGVSSAQQADAHYRAVCRALVAEALELSSFLEVVSLQRQPHLTATSTDLTDSRNVVDLDQLKFADWVSSNSQVLNALTLEGVHYGEGYLNEGASTVISLTPTWKWSF